MKNLQVVENKTQKQLYAEKVKRLCEAISIEELDPDKTAQGRERMGRSLKMLAKHALINNSHIADLGCGIGSFAHVLASQNAHVTAVDALDLLLQKDQYPQINYVKACLPDLLFSDEHFDGLVFTDVIASIEPHLHRLTLSELARVLKKDGWLLISTPLDIDSLDADTLFMQLVRTEFEIIETLSSYHRFHFHLNKWGKSPLWNPLSWFSRPLKKILKENSQFLLLTERLCKKLLGRAGRTHMIILARKKRILYNI
jgi:2-polyprenyl-3-methyl-5-hydroxy-6-metoxy-1,4-benzoquinol methylase